MHHLIVIEHCGKHQLLRKVLESQIGVRGQLSGTFMPLGPWGPLGADKRDPSAAMVTPGSPFSPC